MPLLVELIKLNIEFGMNTSDGILATLKVKPLLIKKIMQAQKVDAEVGKWCEDIKNGRNKDITYDSEGVIRIGKRIYVPNEDELRREILEEAHCSTYAMHLDSIKMYRILREHYRWKKMKT